MALPAAIALSGLNKEYFSDGLNDVFDHGAVLLKSPSLSSVASSDDAYSQESGFSSMSSGTSVARNLAPYFDLLFRTSQVDFKDLDDDLELLQTPDLVDDASQSPKILYDNRDILNLGANIEWKWDFTPAVIHRNTHFFFENRSQYSRVYGADMPAHILVVCSVKECSFSEFHYD